MAKLKVKYVKKPVNKLKIGECASSSKNSRYKGLPVGRVKKGFYIFSRVRSKFYDKPSDIPISEIKRIERFA